MRMPATGSLRPQGNRDDTPDERPVSGCPVQDLLNDHLRVLGPDHPDTLTARASLAYYLGAAGNLDQATAQFRDLVADCLRVLGPDHSSTLITRGNLARWVGEAGQPAQAARQYQDLLDDFLRVLGPEHPHTLTIRYQMAYWQEELRRAD